MIERQRQSTWSGEPHRRAGDALPRAARRRSGPTARCPASPPPRVIVHDEPTILGFPAEVEPSRRRPVHRPDDLAQSRRRRRRAGRVAGPAGDRRRAPTRSPGPPLVLAGAAAAASLWLPWRAGRRPSTGSAAGARGGCAPSAASDGRRSGASGLWQPLAIVLGRWRCCSCSGVLAVPSRRARTGSPACSRCWSRARRPPGSCSRSRRADWNAARFDARHVVRRRRARARAAGRAEGDARRRSAITLRHRRADRR